MHDEVIQFFIFFLQLSMQKARREEREMRLITFLSSFTSIDRDAYSQ